MSYLTIFQENLDIKTEERLNHLTAYNHVKLPDNFKLVARTRVNILEQKDRIYRKEVLERERLEWEKRQQAQRQHIDDFYELDGDGDGELPGEPLSRDGVHIPPDFHSGSLIELDQPESFIEMGCAIILL